VPPRHPSSSKGEVLRVDESRVRPVGFQELLVRALSTILPSSRTTIWLASLDRAQAVRNHQSGTTLEHMGTWANEEHTGRHRNTWDHLSTWEQGWTQAEGGHKRGLNKMV